MRLIRSIILILLTSLLCSDLYAQVVVDSYGDKKNQYILILNSRSNEDTWSNAVSNQIRHEIERQDPEVIVSISYANVTDKNTFLAGRFGMQAAFANGRISEDISIPTVLVLVGDESWMYYRIMNLRGLWENIPVVLVGVHPEIMKDFSKFHLFESIPDSLMIPLEESKQNLPVTAIVEKENEAYTMWLMKQLMPDLEQIVFLSTEGYLDKYAVRALRKSIAVQFPEINLKVVYGSNQTAEDLQTELLGLSGNTAILVGSESVPPYVTVPVFQLNDREISGDIVVGGYYPLKRSYAYRTADVVLRLHRGESANSIPFSFVNGEVPYLNKMALKRFELERIASEVADVEYTNIPVPFLERYRRPFLLLILVVTILVIIFLLSIREKRYRAHILNSMDRYKNIYDEYQILYDNMPMGLVFFDKRGNVLNRNQSSDLFFDKVSSDERGTFNLFQTKKIDVQSKTKIARKIQVNKVFDFDDRSLRLIFRHIPDEKTDGSNIIMIVLDYTEIRKEKMAKEQMYTIFGYAMESSALGVAEYNVIDKNRFATEAWYNNLGISADDRESDVYRFVVEEDRQKIEHFLANIGEDGEVYFADTIRVKADHKIHWLQYVIQLLEYGPEEGRIIVAELLLNIDKQKSNELELGEALQAAKESDRLKNAFIANMSSDIRPALDELIILSKRLIQTGDETEKVSLMERIEQNNDILLRYVERIIELSKTDVTKNMTL